MVTEADYRLQAERLHQQIRIAKLDQLRATLSRERIVAQTRWVEADIARHQLTRTTVKAQIAQEKTLKTRQQLMGARLDTQRSHIVTAQQRDRLHEAEAHRQLNRQQIRERLMAASLDLSAAMTQNRQTQTEQRLKGLSHPSLSRFTPFNS
jgi:hypothetical protein